MKKIISIERSVLYIRLLLVLFSSCQFGLRVFPIEHWLTEAKEREREEKCWWTRDFHRMINESILYALFFLIDENETKRNEGKKENLSQWKSIEFSTRSQSKNNLWLTHIFILITGEKQRANSTHNRTGSSIDESIDTNWRDIRFFSLTIVCWSQHDNSSNCSVHLIGDGGGGGEDASMSTIASFAFFSHRKNRSVKTIFRDRFISFISFLIYQLNDDELRRATKTFTLSMDLFSNSSRNFETDRNRKFFDWSNDRFSNEFR